MPTISGIAPNRDAGIALQKFPNTGSNFQKVDEAVANDDTDYVYLSSPIPGIFVSFNDNYDITNRTDVGQLTSVIVVWRGKHITGTSSGYSSFQIAGQTYTGSNRTLTANYITYTDTFTITGSNNLADYNNAKLGIYLVTNQSSSNGNARCTQLYCDITYNYAVEKIVLSGNKLSIGGSKLEFCPVIS